MRVPSALIAIAVTLISLACASAGRNARAVEGVVPTADGVNLYYKMVGTGSRTIVMPLATWWDPHVTSLTNTYRIVLYDPRDRGRSSEVTNSSSLSLAHEIADLEAVRRHLKIDRMSLVGWSYLGAVVALYAARHPEHVDRVVMVGPIPPRKTPYWSEFVTDLANRKDAMAEAELARAAAAAVQGSDPRELCVLTWRA